MSQLRTLAEFGLLIIVCLLFANQSPSIAAKPAFGQDRMAVTEVCVVDKQNRTRWRLYVENDTAALELTNKNGDTVFQLREQDEGAVAEWSNSDNKVSVVALSSAEEGSFLLASAREPGSGSEIRASLLPFGTGLKLTSKHGEMVKFEWFRPQDGVQP